MNIQLFEKLKKKPLRAGPESNLAGLLKTKLFSRALVGFLLLIICGFMADNAYRKLCHSDFFQITEMKINGNRMVSNKQISILSRVDVHSNLLAIDLPQVKSLLESHPWIARADVKRDWPNRLLIDVSEKQAVALLNRKSGLFYLDKKGGIIAAAGPEQELDFPVVTGLETYPLNSSQSVGTSIVLQDVMKFLRLASRNNSILPEQNISEIHLTGENKFIIFLLERAFPIYMGADGDISTQYYRLVKVLRDLYKTKEFSEVSYIRLDYQEDTILVGKNESGSTHRG